MQTLWEIFQGKETSGPELFGVQPNLQGLREHAEYWFDQSEIDDRDLHRDELAAADSNGKLAALTLKMIRAHKRALDVARALERDTRAAQNGPTSAKKRRENGNNTVTHVERWEREHDRSLSSQSNMDVIRSCANAIHRSETTVKNCLYKRDRDRRKSGSAGR